MHALLLLCVTLAAPPHVDGPSLSRQTEPSAPEAATLSPEVTAKLTKSLAGKQVTLLEQAEPMRLFDLRRAVHNSLGNEARTRETDQHREAVDRLIALFVTVMRHPDLLDEDRLYLRGKLRTRLLSIVEDLERNIERAREEAEKLAKTREPLDKPVDASEVTDAKTVGGFDPFAPAPTTPPTPEARGGAAVIGDHGEELVEVIQATISPDNWDIHGGNNVIIYFAPLKCLVVSAPGEIHHRIGGLVRDLRAAGP